MSHSTFCHVGDSVGMGVRPTTHGKPVLNTRGENCWQDARVGKRRCSAYTIERRLVFIAKRQMNRKTFKDL